MSVATAKGSQASSASPRAAGPRPRERVPLRIVSDAPELAPMALDSEHHGGLWDLPETVLSGAS